MDGPSEFYDRHAGPLYSLALLICEDCEVAAEAVVATMTQTWATCGNRKDEVLRRRLAAQVWRRCTEARRTAPPQSLAWAHGSTTPESTEGHPGQQQALLGLVLFGCHTYRQAAALLGLSAPAAALQLRSVLIDAHTAAR